MLFLLAAEQTKSDRNQGHQCQSHIEDWRYAVIPGLRNIVQFVVDVVGWNVDAADFGFAVVARNVDVADFGFAVVGRNVDISDFGVAIVGRNVDVAVVGWDVDVAGFGVAVVNRSVDVVSYINVIVASTIAVARHRILRLGLARFRLWLGSSSAAATAATTATAAGTNRLHRYVVMYNVKIDRNRIAPVRLVSVLRYDQIVIRFQETP